MDYLNLEKSVVVKGLENYRDIAIELLLCGLHNSGNLTVLDGTPRALMAFKDGTFALVNFNARIEQIISEGYVIDCGWDKSLFLETVKALILKTENQ